MNSDKKQYLNLYLLQQAKITRLEKMAVINPKESEKYNKEIENALNLRGEIEIKIRRVDNGILSELLFQKYICGKTLEEISYILNYSKRHIERLHIEALKKFNI